MNKVFSEDTLARASKLVETRLGLHFPPSRWADLERGLVDAARDLGAGEPHRESEWQFPDEPSARELEALASHLTIGETYFFRERPVFDALRHHVFPELVQRRIGGERRLRIWSAGCCTGEEPYSIAMLLEELVPDIDSWNVSILATDLNSRFLQSAAAGVYKEWSFRDTSPEFRERQFNRLPDGRRELVERVRNRVRFARLNLAEDSFPSLLNNTNATDVILCRNVLMYFSPQRMAETIGRLHRCLSEGGWLVVSPTEASQYLFRQFRPTAFEGAIFYRKEAPERTRHKEEPAAVPAVLPSATAPVAGKSGVPARSAVRRPSKRPEPGGHGTPAEPGFDRAAVLHREGNCTEAQKTALGLVLIEPTHAGALALLARIAADGGRLDEALDWCDRSLAAEKLNPVVHHLRAAILDELGRTGEAEASLKSALYLDPDFALAWLALGHLALRRHDREQARRHFDTVLALANARPGDEELPESGGMTASRLAEIARSSIATAI